MIRRFRKDDIQYFNVFWASDNGEQRAKQRARCFQYLIEGNPFSNSKDDYYVMEEEDRVVAYEGIMPYKFTLLGEDHDGYIYHDTMVDPTKRGHGLGTLLVTNLLRQKQLFSIAVWMNFPNHKMFEKCGWLPVTNIYSYFKIYDIGPLFRNRERLANKFVINLSRLIFLFIHKVKNLFIDFTCAKDSIEVIEQFDDSVDLLYHSVKNHFKYIAYRIKDTLNWKYANNKSTKYSKLVYLENHHVKGYVVYSRRSKQESSIARIEDFLCSPERTDILQALLSKAISEIELTKPSYIHIISTDKTMNNVLKKLGFIGIKKEKAALKFVDPRGASNPNDLSNGSNWFFTCGDGDGAFWNF